MEKQFTILVAGYMNPNNNSFSANDFQKKIEYELAKGYAVTFMSPPMMNLKTGQAFIVITFTRTEVSNICKP